MMATKAKRRLWWTGFSVYALAVLIVGVIPLPPVGPQIPSFDSVEHGLEYILFSWLLARAQLASGRAWAQAMRRAVLGAVVYGGVIELIQVFLPYRNAEWLDLAANGLGGWIGTWLVHARLRGVTRG